MKLISMTDFVLEQEKAYNDDDYHLLSKIISYAEFLKQPLNLSMFVPCKLVDGVWVFLEEPVYTSPSNKFYNEKYIKDFQEAKDRVLFEGFRQNIYNETGSFEIIDETGFQVCMYKALPKYFLWLGCPEERNIESAMKFHDFKLTPTAKKQIGLN